MLSFDELYNIVNDNTTQARKIGYEKYTILELNGPEIYVGDYIVLISKDYADAHVGSECADAANVSKFSVTNEFRNVVDGLWDNTPEDFGGRIHAGTKFDPSSGTMRTVKLSDLVLMHDGDDTPDPLNTALELHNPSGTFFVCYGLNVSNHPNISILSLQGTSQSIFTSTRRQLQSEIELMKTMSRRHLQDYTSMCYYACVVGGFDISNVVGGVTTSCPIPCDGVVITNEFLLNASANNCDPSCITAAQQTEIVGFVYLGNQTFITVSHDPPTLPPPSPPPPSPPPPSPPPPSPPLPSPPPPLTPYISPSQIVPSASESMVFTVSDLGAQYPTIFAFEPPLICLNLSTTYTFHSNTTQYTFAWDINYANVYSGVTEFTTPSSVATPYKRYFAVEFQDVLYYDVPYCGEQGPPPPPSNNLATVYILFESDLDLLDCNISQVQNNTQVKIYSVL